MQVLAGISLPLVHGGDLVKAITIPLLRVRGNRGSPLHDDPADRADGEPEPEGAESGETAG
jgi:hypothetical protein